MRTLCVSFERVSLLRAGSYPLKQESMITCMSSLPKSIDEPAPASNHSTDLEFRWCLRLVETGVGAL